MPASTARDLHALAEKLPPEVRTVVERMASALEQVAHAQQAQSEAMVQQGALIKEVAATLASMDKRITYFENHDVAAKIAAHETRLVVLETDRQIRSRERQLVGSALTSPIIPWIVVAIGIISILLMKGGIILQK